MCRRNEIAIRRKVESLRVKELEKVVIKLCTQARIKYGTIKDEEAGREESERKLIEVRPSSLLVACFHVG
jgi:hypothetical protein